MFEVVLLAVALSMDAFAVSIGLGSKPEINIKNLPILAALYFGIFQGMMPLIGFLGGQGLLGWVEHYADWIAFGLLALIGGKMIYEALSEGIEEDISKITHRMMLLLAIATSIDAMAAGFALTLLEVSVWLACLIIALTTMGFSYLGVYIGQKSGTWLESKAELFGGVVLILIGVKMVI